MPEFTIRSATEADVDSILRLAGSLTIDHKHAAGFLVSNFTRDDYIEFLGHAQADKTDYDLTFFVAEDDLGVAGFLLCYDLRYLLKKGEERFLETDTTERRLVDRFGRDTGFYVIKQVGVRPDQFRTGVGSRLYQAFIEHTLSVRSRNTILRPKDKLPWRLLPTRAPKVSDPDIVDVFVAVMIRPDNPGSLEFHRRKGFRTVYSWSSGAIGDPKDELKSRLVMHATSQEILAGYTRDVDADAAIHAMLSSLEYAKSLYKHEDDLNWTKLSYLSQYSSALIAAQFVVASFGGAGKSLPVFLMLLLMSLLIGAVAIYLSWSFSIKLRSGLLFMAAHKRAALLVESKLNHIFPGFYPSVTSVPRQSDTVKLIRRARRVFLILSVLATVFAVAFISIRYSY
ncbi:MAG: hypothetical protein AAGJ70_02570 [Pseudomonadota bacterium]